MPEEVHERRWFLIDVSPGKLWILPIVALIVFLWVVLVASDIILLPALEDDVSLKDWALLGSGILVVLLFAELLLLIGRKRKARAAPAPAEAAPGAAVEEEPFEEGFEAPGEDEDFALPPELPAEVAPGVGARTDEFYVTEELFGGRRVVEYCRPPKDLAGDGVFTKTFVPVNEEYVLRIEEIVAEPV